MTEATRAVLEEAKVVMADRRKVEDKVEKIVKGGPDNLQFVVDFDYTLSRSHKAGKPVDCSWGVLENYHQLPSSYHEKVQAIKAKYYPIELDLTVSLEDKIPIMIQWYREANELLAESGVERDWFPKMVAESNCELRDFTDLMMNQLAENKVPVLVLSAGLGDMVKEILSHFNVFHENTLVVSNFLDFDEAGKVVGLKNKDRMIHMFNKSESALKGAQAEHLQTRKNVVLLGDSLGDLKMADGVKNPDVVLTVGFLNKKIEDNLAAYKEAFDVVLVDDQTMDFPNAILSDMLKK